MGAYIPLDLGALTILGGWIPRQAHSRLALVGSGLVVLTTIHIQDLQDAYGDPETGRQTTVVRFGQSVTRASIRASLVLWATVLPFLWGAPLALRLTYAGLGLVVGVRTYWVRDKARDERTFRLFNAWLIAIHLLVVAPIIGAVPLSSNAHARFLFISDWCMVLCSVRVCPRARARAESLHAWL